MRFIAVFVLLFALTVSSFAGVAEAKTIKVKGYTNSKGTYVPSYYKTSPNSNKLDNWSTKGNYNPYTGKKGTKSYYGW